MDLIVRGICTVLFTIIVSQNAASQQQGVKQIRLTDFRLQSSSLIRSSGEELSSAKYKPDIYWFPVKVPCTVLSGLVTNGIYPDPYSGLNNMLIPDASDEFNKQYNLDKYSHLPNDPNPWKKPYWYRTEFMVPASESGSHFQLIFKGINYRAAVWVNGKQIADSTRMAGMFAEYGFDITGDIRTGKQNAIAVKIYPLDYPGLPATEQLKAFGDFFENGGPTGDIGKNVTMLCSVGWDWIPPVRDRNMGIWLPVYLRISGGTTISKARIITELPNLPDTSIAKLSVNLTLTNHSEQNESGNLMISVSPENFKGKGFRINRKVDVAKGKSTVVDINPTNAKEFIINKPSLWWPNGYGNPNLYRIRLQYSADGKISDDTTFLFGVRTISSKSVSVNGFWRRDFYVNGNRIHITGGAWVPDMMLNRDSTRYDYEMHLCRNANINLVRIWGGGVTPCDEFFDAADRYGLLVWSDFWITGDTQGEFKGSPDWPVDGSIFKSNVTSTILRIRNHPGLLVWTGGNEGHARKDLYDFMRRRVIELDGTRPFIPSSSGFARLPQGWDASWPDNLPGGVYSGGPYTWQDPVTYYKKVNEQKDWVFKDETGIPSMVTWDILPKIIPDLVWDKTLPFPLNDSWGYHDAASGNGHWELYYKEMVRRYGEPSDMEDFCNKMQLMNAAGYQGIFESAGHKLNDVGGVMLWKLNAAFPSVVWQVYDWYLQTNAGYYFMQNACEPLHIQLNLLNHKVTVINRRYKPAGNLTAHVELFDLTSRSLFSEEAYFSLRTSEVKELMDISDEIEKVKGISFVVLNLKDLSGKIVSHNVYWLSPDNDFRELKKMPAATVSCVVVKTENSKTESKWRVQLTNNSSKIAFFIRSGIIAEGEEILPGYWSGNYITLAPGESEMISIGYPLVKTRNKKLTLDISGWNIPDQAIILSEK